MRCAAFVARSSSLPQGGETRVVPCGLCGQGEPAAFDIDHIANYWVVTVNKILADNGIGEMVAWEDGLRGTDKSQYATESVAINFWETLCWGGIGGLTDIVEDGFDIIMNNSDYLYFG